MIKRGQSIFLFLVLLASGGCATLPAGPGVTVLPSPGKSLEQFQAEDAFCRQWAQQQIGGITPQETLNQDTTRGAIVGTVIGSGLGTLISGRVGAGTVIGGALGLLIGASEGSEDGRVYGWEAQRRYDIAYQQCMYAKGNQVPGMKTRPVQKIAPPPPPPGTYYIPPDYVPPLYPPPPPPGQ